MIRKNTNGDISDEEFEAILKPFIDDYDNFVISYIMPEVLVNYLKKAKLEAKQLNGFMRIILLLEMHFQSVVMLLLIVRMLIAKKLVLNKLDYMISGILVHHY